MSERIVRVLIVDDEEGVRRILIRILTQRLKYEVVEEATGEAALARLEGSEHFDYIISDIVMPGMSGVDLFAAVRRIAHRRGVSFMLMSGWTPLEESEKIKRLGAIPFLEKPFSASQVLELFKEK